MNRVSDLVHCLMGMFLAVGAVSIIGTGCRASQPSTRPATTVPSARNIANPATEESQGPFRVILVRAPAIIRVGEPFDIAEILVNISDQPVLANFHTANRWIHVIEEELQNVVVKEGGTRIEFEIDDPFPGVFPHTEMSSHHSATVYKPWDTQCRIYTSVVAGHAGVFDLNVEWTSSRPAKAGGDVWVGKVQAKPLRINVIEAKEKTPATTQPATSQPG